MTIRLRARIVSWRLVQKANDPGKQEGPY
jgi:hypothetical protein